MKMRNGQKGRAQITILAAMGVALLGGLAIEGTGAAAAADDGAFFVKAENVDEPEFAGIRGMEGKIEAIPEPEATVDPAECVPLYVKDESSRDLGDIVITNTYTAPDSGRTVVQWRQPANLFRVNMWNVIQVRVTHADGTISERTSQEGPSGVCPFTENELGIGGNNNQLDPTNGDVLEIRMVDYKMSEFGGELNESRATSWIRIESAGPGEVRYSYHG
jgi:hypothetical protein